MRRPFNERGEANDPTPEEIAEGCRMIRESWPPGEDRTRAAWMFPQHVEIEPIDTNDCPEP